MICLCLTHPRLEENRKALESCLPWTGMVELRVDRLQDDQFPLIPGFLAAVWSDFGLKTIVTLRLPEDGGSWSLGEKERQSLMAGLAAAIPAGPGDPIVWFDLEENLDSPELELTIIRAGGGIIRSFHDFTLTPQNLEKRIDDLENLGRSCMPGRFMVKAAVMVRGSRDLLVLVRAARSLGAQGRRFILAGMGPAGVPSRILAPLLGSWLTYSSPPGDGKLSAAPGHMDPRMLEEVYGHSRMGASTRVLGIIGNPVLHTKSPAYHNRIFAQSRIDAVYVPFQTDDLGAFMELAEELDMPGFSVTIPHKEGIREFLDQEEAAIGEIGACNTVLRRGGLWYGMNTDAPGFLNPLRPLMDTLKPRPDKALVIGAGGASRAIVQSLLASGLEVLILNRTENRAKELAHEFSRWYPGKTASAGLEFMVEEQLRPYSRVVVQTTSMGMEGADEDKDPLPGFEFSGGELVCDIVYVPEKTVFLRRAEASGCLVQNGMPMFLEQARLQSIAFAAAMGESEKEA